MKRKLQPAYILSLFVCYITHIIYITSVFGSNIEATLNNTNVSLTNFNDSYEPIRDEPLDLSTKSKKLLYHDARVNKTIIPEKQPDAYILIGQHESTVIKDKDNTSLLNKTKKREDKTLEYNCLSHKRLKAAHRFSHQKAHYPAHIAITNNSTHCNLLSDANNSTVTESVLFLQHHTTTKSYTAVFDLLQNLLFYRSNIAKFFKIFYNKINKNLEVTKDESIKKRDAIITEFLLLSIEFAKHNENKNVFERSEVALTTIEKLRSYERYIIDQRQDDTKLILLSKSKEYNELKQYNLSFNKEQSTVLRYTEFRFLYHFLVKIISRTLIVTRYYNMLYSLLCSLYKVHIVFNEIINSDLQSHLLTIKALEVPNCYCGIEVKKWFIFHWAFCWISFFSSYEKLPNFSVNKACAYESIKKYPTEFFIQFILLIHIAINFEHKKISLQDLELYFILLLKRKIYTLLHVNVQDQNYSVLHMTLYNLFNKIKTIKTNIICHNTTVLNITMEQTIQDNIILSKGLNPALEDLLKIVYSLTKDSYRQSLVIISNLI